MATVVIGPFSIDDKEDAAILEYFRDSRNRSAAFRDAMNSALGNTATLERISAAIGEVQAQLESIENRLRSGVTAIAEMDIPKSEDEDVRDRLNSLFGE